MKKIVILGLCGVLLLTGCGKKENKKTSDVLNEHGKTIITISAANKGCVPVRISFYDDGVYELFNEYETCKPDTDCDAVLTFTKSVHGNYEYDLNKIIEKSNSTPTFDAENMPLYEIYPGEGFEGESYYYTINQNDAHEELDELLKKINVNLDECAKANYIE